MRKAVIAAKRATRIEGLDGVRALAIGLVLLSHAAGTPRFVIPEVDHWFNPELGKFGVLIFFVLSGFLQTRLLLEEESLGLGISPRRFYARRILRVAPTLLVYLMFVAMWGQVTDQRLEALEYLSVIGCFKHIVEGAPLIAHFWSLSIEILFYFVWPLVLLRVKGSFRPALALACVFLMPLSSPLIESLYPDHGRFYPSVFFRAEAIMAGCWLGFVSFSAPLPGWWRRFKAFPDQGFVLSLVSGMALVWVSCHTSGGMTKTAAYGLLLACSCVMLVTAMHCRWNWLHTLMNGAATGWLARVSFSVYVWQQFFMFGEPFGALAERFGASTFYPLFWFPGNVLGSLAVGSLCYALIEKPLEPLRRRLSA